MFPVKLDIQNFRGIKELSVPLDDLCVLIGENNTGKSTILDAFHICMTRPYIWRGPIFKEYDYHLGSQDSDPSTCDPIRIVITFAGNEQIRIQEEISQLMADVEQIADDGTSCVIFRVESRFDRELHEFTQDYDFLDLAGEPLTVSNMRRLVLNLQNIWPTSQLSALRDASKAFSASSTFWRPFVRSLDISESEKSDLERQLLELNKLVVEKHSAFKVVGNHLEKVAEQTGIRGAGQVWIDAIPSRIFDILSRAQVNLASGTGAKIPVGLHGSGTQSIAVISLFEAFINSKLEEDGGGFLGSRTNHILALEEPEAHLHPSAVRSFARRLQGLKARKLISTHSGDLLSEIPFDSIRRLRRTNGAISIHRYKDGLLSDAELRKLDHAVRSSRGNLLFARCWLLVEGETEAVLIPECAKTMGSDLHLHGVSCVEYAQIGIDKLIKLADQFGIEWFALMDGDSAGKKYWNAAKRELKGREQQKHILRLSQPNMELFLCVAGFDDVYKGLVSKQKEDLITADESKDKLKYCDQISNALVKNGKIKAIMKIVDKINENGKRRVVPDLLQEVISRACELASNAQ